MWIESDADNTPVSGEWIVARLTALIASLRERDSRFRDREPRRFLDPARVYEAVARGSPDRAVSLVCEKYGVEPSRVRLTWVPDMTDQGAAAHVRSEPLGHVEVTIREAYRRDPAGFGTVIAHEIGHAYLTDHDIENGGDWEAEATTDLVTFAVGLGKLTVNGVAHLGVEQRAGSRGYGYLNREGVVFAYARAATHFGLARAEARAGLNPAALGYFNMLYDDEPGPLQRLGHAVLRWLGFRKTVPERDLVVDENGAIVDRGTGRAL